MDKFSTSPDMEPYAKIPGATILVRGNHTDTDGFHLEIVMLRSRH